MNNVIVTGMHRSGTSAIGRILHENGYKMGEQLMGKCVSNKYGHFEEKNFVKIHHSLILKYYNTEYKPWMIKSNSIKFEFKESDKNKLKELWKKYSIHSFGFKDPRTCLFLGLWIEIIPYIKFIICLRHPYDVYLSILKRSKNLNEKVEHKSSVIMDNWYYHNKFVFDCIKLYGPNKFLILNTDIEFNQSKLLNCKLNHFLDFDLKNIDKKIDKDIFTKSALKTESEYKKFEEFFPRNSSLFYNLQFPNIKLLEFPDKGTVEDFEKELKRI